MSFFLLSSPSSSLYHSFPLSPPSPHFTSLHFHLPPPFPFSSSSSFSLHHPPPLICLPSPPLLPPPFTFPFSSYPLPYPFLSSSHPSSFLHVPPSNPLISSSSSPLTLISSLTSPPSPFPLHLTLLLLHPFAPFLSTFPHPSSLPPPILPCFSSPLSLAPSTPPPSPPPPPSSLPFLSFLPLHPLPSPSLPPPPPAPFLSFLPLATPPLPLVPPHRPSYLASPSSLSLRPLSLISSPPSLPLPLPSPRPFLSFPPLHPLPPPPSPPLNLPSLPPPPLSLFLPFSPPLPPFPSFPFPPLPLAPPHRPSYLASPSGSQDHRSHLSTRQRRLTQETFCSSPAVAQPRNECQCQGGVTDAAYPRPPPHHPPFAPPPTNPFPPPHLPMVFPADLPLAKHPQRPASDGEIEGQFVPPTSTISSPSTGISSSHTFIPPPHRPLAAKVRKDRCEFLV
ncbi:hypothetical protein C7M84_010090 [Penaeus vannamei]|uniref:Uncharacterized protein n=1 Tax=Penaeus vannamei TaxID=6689 RepID=A0A3R7M4D5_PENVA|nr:hypothetical protein C7M84_010090 [Penaeus vannamei]